MGFYDDDFVDALVIALFILAFIALVWPGYWRATPAKLAGYWQSNATGALYEVRPAGGRAFEVRADGAAVGQGRVTGVRGVTINGKKGSLGLTSRQIDWDDDYWTLQGVAAG